MTLTGNFVKMVLENLTKYYCNYPASFKFYLRRFSIIFVDEEKHAIIFTVATVWNHHDDGCTPF